MNGPDVSSFQNTTAKQERRPMVTLDRKFTIFPNRPSQRQRCRLTASDLQMLSCNYIQKGIFFEMSESQNFESMVTLLKNSLSEILVYFYPLAGRLITSEEDGVVYVDCNDGGVDFIEASASEDVCLAEIETEDMAAVIRQLFAPDGAVNYDGHFLPLLAVQATKMRDGIGIGLTINHAVTDGTSLWHFVNSWSQLCRGSPSISVQPVHDRSLGGNSLIKFRIRECDIQRYSPPPLREKVFHFSKDMISRLKDRANEDRKDGASMSSFQALCGHVWQAITRARRLNPDERTTFKLAVNCRPRLEPPLPPSYFGNAIQNITARITAGQLLGNDLSFVAGLLHRIIISHRDADIREGFDRWEKEPVLFKMGEFGANDVGMGSSPRFAMYDNDFGWGKPVAVRSGRANKFDGKISAYPGREGDGSADLEICLLPRVMNALQTDEKFLYV